MLGGLHERFYHGRLPLFQRPVHLYRNPRHSSLLSLLRLSQMHGKRVQRECWCGEKSLRTYPWEPEGLYKEGRQRKRIDAALLPRLRLAPVHVLATSSRPPLGKSGSLRRPDIDSTDLPELDTLISAMGGDQDWTSKLRGRSQLTQPRRKIQEICTILGAQVMCTSVYANVSGTLILRADLAHRIRTLESIDFLTAGADARDRGNIAQLELKP